MTMFAFSIWLGGVFANPNIKIGILHRLAWPMALGEQIASWAWEDRNV